MPPLAPRPMLAVTVSAGTPSSSGLSPLRLEARGPSRFFTVEATTGGGSVAVEVVQEGSLRLRTGGGSIAVPKVRGSVGSTVSAWAGQWLCFALQQRLSPTVHGQGQCTATRPHRRSRHLTRIWTLRAVPSPGRSLGWMSGCTLAAAACG